MINASLTRTVVLALATTFGAGYLTGCASSEGSRSTGQVIDDASITTRVKAALAKEQGVGNALDVNVTTRQGTVQLSGFVDSREVADRAAEVARRIEGVRTVRDDLVVQTNQPSSSTGTGARGR